MKLIICALVLLQAGHAAGRLLTDDAGGNAPQSKEPTVQGEAAESNTPKQAPDELFEYEYVWYWDNYHRQWNCVGRSSGRYVDESYCAFKPKIDSRPVKLPAPFIQKEDAPGLPKPSPHVIHAYPTSKARK